MYYLQISQSDHTCHHPHRFTELATKRWKGEWEAHTGMCQMLEMHLRKLLWMYCARHTVVTGNDPVDRLVGREGRGAVWSQGHHAIDRPEERGVVRGSTERSSLKGRERDIVNQTNIGTVSKATMVKHLRDGIERIRTFWSSFWNFLDLFLWNWNKDWKNHMNRKANNKQRLS